MSRPIRSRPWHVQRPPSSIEDREGSTDSQTIYPEGGSLAGEVDLRAAIAEIMANRGHYVFIRRAQDRRCGCWNEVFREADSQCPHCTGTGWLYVDQKVLSRKMLVTDPGIAVLLEQRSPIGLMAPNQSIFWFEHTVGPPGPSKRDLILEVTLNQETGEPVKPYKIETQWNIGQVHDYRDKYGRIEYWACWCKSGILGKE